MHDPDMNTPQRACQGGPRSTILQAAVSLVDQLIEDGEDLHLDGRVIGASSASRVDAVNDLYRALGLELRPDVVDLARARRDSLEQGLSPQWLRDAMHALIRRRTVPS